MKRHELTDQMALEELVTIGRGPKQHGIYPAVTYRLHRVGLDVLKEQGLVAEVVVVGPDRFYRLTRKGKAMYDALMKRYQGGGS